MQKQQVQCDEQIINISFPTSTMPHVSEKTRLLQEISSLEFKVLAQRLENLQCQVNEDKSEDIWHDDNDNDDNLDSILLLPPSPISPLPSNVKSDFESDDLINLTDARCYDRYFFFNGLSTFS